VALVTGGLLLGLLVGTMAPEHVASNAYYKMVKPIVARR
jgi:hypothetical protein